MRVSRRVDGAMYVSTLNDKHYDFCTSIAKPNQRQIRLLPTFLAAIRGDRNMKLKNRLSHRVGHVVHHCKTIPTTTNMHCYNIWMHPFSHRHKCHRRMIRRCHAFRVTKDTEIDKHTTTTTAITSTVRRTLHSDCLFAAYSNCMHELYEYPLGNAPRARLCQWFLYLRYYLRCSICWR